MKIDRLLAITMHLLSRKKSTAGELAELFSVSKRTIYRDLETINVSGIPVVSFQGNGGGYGIAENFTIGRSFFKRDELKVIAGMLRSVAGAVNDPGLDRTVEKITALEPREETGFEVIEDGLVLDLTPWWGLGGVQDTVSIFRKALKRKRPVRFSYTNLKGEPTLRGRMEELFPQEKIRYSADGTILPALLSRI